MRNSHKLWLIILIFLINSIVFAQGNQVTVPDVLGLNIPQAAAKLNEVGLRLGAKNAIEWSADAPYAEGLVGEQSVAAGEMVTTGTTIDIGVYRSANMLLIYDDNDLTVVNTTDGVADVTGLRFVVTEGSTPASFAATRWASSVRNHRCLQVWSISRRQSKNVDQCESIQNWLTTNDTGEHFWTAANGVQKFSVVEDGVERASCDGASSPDTPLQCSFYLAGASSAENITPFIYFAYTTDGIAIINQSDDQWMPTDSTNIINNNPKLQVPGVSLIMGDPTLFKNPDIVADITNLAPHQCIMLTSGHPEGATPPQACNLIAQRDLSADVAFWLADFQVESATDAELHTCPAAKQNTPTICVVPR